MDEPEDLIEVPVFSSPPFDPNVVEATMFSRHMKEDRKARAGLPIEEIYEALREEHFEQSSQNPKYLTCTEHYVRMKGANYIVITGSPDKYVSEWAARYGIFLWDDDEVVITVLLSNASR